METKTEQERMHALALSTARRIESEAAAIQWLEAHEDESLEHYHEDGIDTTAEAEVERIAAEANGHRAVLELDDILDPDTPFGDGLEEAKDRLRFEGPLSIRRYGYNDGNGDGWETESVTIVLGTGGPHVEVQYRGDRAIVVAYGWFGADRVEIPVNADAVETVYGVDYLYHDG